MKTFAVYLLSFCPRRDGSFQPLSHYLNEKPRGRVYAHLSDFLTPEAPEADQIGPVVRTLLNAHPEGRRGGGGTQQGFTLEGFAKRSNPLSFYIPFLTGKVSTPFVYLQLTNCTPFTYLV